MNLQSLAGRIANFKYGRSEREQTTSSGIVDLSFETLDLVYHTLQRLDSLLGVSRGRPSIFYNVVSGCLYGSELALDVLLSGAEYFTVVLVGNLRK